MNTEARVEVGVVGGGVVLQSGWTFVSKSVYNRGTGPNLGTLMLCSYTTIVERTCTAWVANSIDESDPRQKSRVERARPRARTHSQSSPIIQ